MDRHRRRAAGGRPNNRAEDRGERSVESDARTSRFGRGRPRPSGHLAFGMRKGSVQPAANRRLQEPRRDSPTGCSTVPSGPPMATRAADELDASWPRTEIGRRADCMARIQTDAVQLALDLLVREPDIEGFFRAFIKTLVDECESHACGVWLLDEDGRAATVDGLSSTAVLHDSDARIGTPLRCRAKHGGAPGATGTAGSETVDYPGRCAAARSGAAFNAATASRRVLVAPLVLPARNLGWIALRRGSVGVRGHWRGRAARSDGAAGHAGASPEPAGRTEPLEAPRRRCSRNATASRATSTTP